MTLTIVAPPDAPVVTVEEAADHLRIDADQIEANRPALAREIGAVTSWLAGRDGWLGRSLVTQKLQLTIRPWATLDTRRGRWDGRERIVLPRPPFVGVDSVTYVDEASTAILVAPSAYTVVQGDDGLTRLEFLSGFAWPGSGELDVVKVLYTAGYGPAGPDVDPAIRQGILQAVAQLHENRGDVASLSDPSIRELFSPYRVFGAPS